MTRPVTIELDEATITGLERAAREAGLTVEETIRDWIEAMVDTHAHPGAPPLTAEEKAKIERGIAQADAGQVVSHDQVKADHTRRFGK